MIRRPPRSTHCISSAASDVYKRQPKNLDLSIVDKVEQVTNDESIEMALRLAKEEGLLVGISCGAAAAAAVRLAEQDEYAGKTIVVVLPDLAERYLSSIMFTEVPSGIIQEPVKA